MSEPILEEFYLSQDLGSAEIEHDAGVLGQWRWMPRMYKGTMHSALMIVPDEAVLTPLIRFGHDMCLDVHLSQGLDTISDDGLDAELFFRGVTDERDDVLCRLPLRPSRENEFVATFELRQLEGSVGKLGIRCGAGPLGDPSSDWLGIFRWIVARRDRLGLLNGRANRTTRINNERLIFGSIYDHPLFANRREGEVREADDGAPLVPLTPNMTDRGKVATPMLSAEELATYPFVAVSPDENVYQYMSRLVSTLMGGPQIDFASRLRKLSEGNRTVRVLSLCTGAGAIERNIVRAAGVPLEMTILDITTELLTEAKASLSPFGSVKAMLGDVNDIEPEWFDQKFEVVVCCSGLHHVVELERVIECIANLITADGEFWSIGEQVGRDGNRLWPEAADVANEIFARLPPEFRRNCHTGDIDSIIPDIDFSAPCYEGIRSSEIERILDGYLEPVVVEKSSCFSWRVFEATYFSNYDLKLEEHRRIVLEFVAAEYNFWRQGGRTVQLNGVFRSRPGFSHEHV